MEIADLERELDEAMNALEMQKNAAGAFSIWVACR